MPAGAPRTLATASLAANRAARERVFSSRSAGTNSLSRSPGVRSSWRPNRSISTTSTPMPTIMALFYGHALGQVAWLVHVVTLGRSECEGEDLQRNRCEQRRQERRGLRDVEDVLGVRLDGLVALFGDHDRLGAAGTDFLDVGDHLGVQRVAAARGRDHHEDGLAFLDQRDRAVLEFYCGGALGVDVRELLELERALHRHRETDVAAQEQHGLGVSHGLAEFLDLGLVVEDALDLGRDLAQVGQDVLDL